MSRPPVGLTIAGSDPSGGAGIAADLKTFSALGVYGTSVVTALTAQSTQGVTGVHVAPTEFVTQQLETLIADVRLDTIKIGMLANAAIVGAAGYFLRHLLDDHAIQAVRELMPLASLVTPNLAEAAALLDTRPARTLPDLRFQATALQELGAPRVLIKGGHQDEGAEAVDLLLDVDGETLLRAPRVDTLNTHGTGCTLSSALAALRPQRDSWLEAALDAKSWLTEALAAADVLEIGQGHGPVHHFHEIWDH